MPKGKNPKADDDDLSDLDGLDISGGAANPMAADPTGMIAKMTDPAAVQKKMKKYVLERVFDFGLAFFGSRGPGVQVAGKDTIE